MTNSLFVIINQYLLQILVLNFRTNIYVKTVFLLRRLWNISASTLTTSWFRLVYLRSIMYWTVYVPSEFWIVKPTVVSCCLGNEGVNMV